MRILFFHQGRIDDWAGAVLNGLRSQFPKAEVLVFDLHKLLKARPVIFAGASIAAGLRYGRDLAFGKRDADDAFFTTEYIFEKVREISAGIHAAYPSDFSFQMHSMHDHGSPDRPHFVYTDFTYSDCRKYSVYGEYKWAPLRSDRLIELEHGIYDRATCTFTQTQAVASTLIDDYGIAESQVLNVRYGPNINAGILGAIDRANEDNEKLNILFIGNDWHRKGGAELVQAFARISPQHPGARLVIVGSQPKIDQGIADVLGKVPLCQLPGIFAEAAIFCMPSKMEPSAGVYVEAMHAGLPVVALDTPATREVVRDGETGFLIRDNDVSGLSSVLAKLLASPELRSLMGARGREVATKQFRWESTFNQVGDRIRSYLSESGNQIQRLQWPIFPS